MIKNYLLVALRAMRRNRVFATINILGLAMGMSVCFLILLFVHHELSYDTFHSKAERVYRLKYLGVDDLRLARVPPVMAAHIPDYFPEVEAIARLYPRNISVQVGTGDLQKRFEETRVYFADTTIHALLDFEVIAGSDQALTQPGKLMLSERIARKYFGDEEAVGKTIRFNDQQSYQVGAVFADYPNYSHLQFHVLLPYEEMFAVDDPQTGATAKDNLSRNWVMSHSFLYLLLQEGADPATFDARVEAFMDDKMPDWAHWGQTFELQPMLDIQLKSNMSLEAEPVGSMREVRLFSIVALLILVIACMNFINLSTAQALKRGREVGMRKVMGAGKQHLVFQFLGESALVGTIAFVLSIIVVSYGLPVLNTVMQREIVLTDEVIWEVMPLFAGIYLATILLAGFYPSLHMTRFKIIPTLKGGADPSSGRFPIRKVLVVSQFALSVLLISGTIIIYSQVDLLLNKPKGFDTEHILAVPMFSENTNALFTEMDSAEVNRYLTFKEQVLRHPAILDATLSSMVPGVGTSYRGLLWEGKETEDREYQPCAVVDHDFLEFYDVPLLSGRSFEPNNTADAQSAVIINRKAVATFGWGTPEQALGKKVDLEGKSCTVIGVCEDFNFFPLNMEHAGLVMEMDPAHFAVFSIKYRGAELAGLQAELEELWGRFFPAKVFEPYYLDDMLADSYNNETQFRRMITYFGILAIFISCLGSYGLILYSAQRRTKEIGIRKVLGAPVSQIIYLLFREFTILFVIGFLLSIPIAWYLADLWLEDFSYRISLGPEHFLLGGLVTILIIWATISYQSIRSALMNPVKALRTE